MKESALRDLIAQKISQLKPGLTLLQKEQYIPGEHGTKSFIDLYARDEKGRHVLIELKRSNTAARQALHEVSTLAQRIPRYSRSLLPPNGESCFSPFLVFVRTPVFPSKKYRLT